MKKNVQPKRINVAADVGVARVAGLLGRDVVERAERHAAGRQIGGRIDLPQPRQAHVDQLRLAARRDQEVRRLDVAMHHVPFRGVGQGLGHLQRVTDGLGQGQRAAAVNQVANVDPLDELEDDVMQPAVFADIVDAGDVLVVQAGGRLGLVLEAQLRFLDRPRARARGSSGRRSAPGGYRGRGRPCPSLRRRRTPAARSDRAARQAEFVREGFAIWLPTRRNRPAETDAA